jgi:NAD(P)-dependent dehydrogenase (short-subunit alcohol dehydrogenase family)
MELEGKKVFVTGAGQGIGKAIARQCLLEGAAACGLELDAEAAKETEKELSHIGDIRIFQGDAGSELSVRSAIKKSVDKMGGLDILVNNAGIFIGEAVPVEKLTLAQWNRVLAVNLTSIFLTVKYALPFFKLRGGIVVNIASTRALMSEGNTEAYSASKGGVAALTHALAVSLGPKVRVNCISPGWIDTGSWQKVSRRRQTKLRVIDGLQHPAGRVGKPEDIAEAAVFLASAKSGFTTGANFVIDGGMTRKMIYAE